MEPVPPLEREDAELIRVSLAAERTHMAWIRTGLALMGFGFLVARFGLFMQELVASQVIPARPSTGLSLWLGTALVLLGTVVNLLAARRHYGLLLRIGSRQSRYLPKQDLGVIVSVILGLLGLVMVSYLLLLGWWEAHH